jgi:hypothetical protein
MMGDPAAVLELARAVLDGRYAVPKRQRARMAALLARQALEATVDALCGPTMRRASMRSRLTYLRIIVDQQRADRAGVAWAGLSQACHHHSYELTPTTAEVEYLIDLVSDINPRVVTPAGP